MLAGFIGAPSMNFLAVKVEGTEVQGIGAQPVALPQGKATAVEIGIRPEHINVVPAVGAGITGVVELLERLGAETYAYIRVEGQANNLTLRLSGDADLRPGSKVGLAPDWAQVHWFDPAGKTL